MAEAMDALQISRGRYSFAYREKRIVAVCIKILQERIHEIQPKNTDPKYKKARYGKKKKAK